MIEFDYQIDGFKSPEAIGESILKMRHENTAQISAEDAAHFTKFEPSTYDGTKTGLIDLAILSNTGENDPVVIRIIEAAEAIAKDGWVPPPLSVRQNGRHVTHVYFHPEEVR